MMKWYYSGKEHFSRFFRKILNNSKGNEFIVDDFSLLQMSFVIKKSRSAVADMVADVSGSEKPN
jgi:hypothetical protein